MPDHRLRVRGAGRLLLLLTGLLHLTGVTADPLVHAAAAARQLLQIERGIALGAAPLDEEAAGAGSHWQCAHCRMAGAALTVAPASSAPVQVGPRPRLFAHEGSRGGSPKFRTPPARAPPSV